jgi:hypothetical protein
MVYYRICRVNDCQQRIHRTVTHTGAASGERRRQSGMPLAFLYLNPVFLSSSTHKYNTDDYYTVDPPLGNTETLRKLISLPCYSSADIASLEIRVSNTDLR